LPWLSRIRARFDIAVSFSQKLFSDFSPHQCDDKSSYQSFFCYKFFALSQVEREKSNSEIARNVTREQVEKKFRRRSDEKKKFSQDVLTLLTDCFVFEIIRVRILIISAR
jgi:hypothetical protein